MPAPSTAQNTVVLAVAAAAIAATAALLTSETPRPVPEASSSKSPSQPDSADEWPEDLADLSDSQLIQLLNRIADSPDYDDHTFYTGCVVEEMTKRGEPIFATAIAEVLHEFDKIIQEQETRLTALAAKGANVSPYTEWTDSDWWENATPSQKRATDEAEDVSVILYRYTDNFSLVSGLCKLLKDGPPLSLKVKSQRPLSTWPELPTLDVAIRNTDPRQRTVSVSVDHQFGYLQLRNLRTGTEIEPIDPRRIGYVDRLAFGETKMVSVDLTGRFAPLPPGDYELTISEFGTATSVVFRVFDQDISQKSDVTKAIKQWLAELDRSAPPHILETRYGLWASELIPPSTPLGKLLAARWQAVPALLDELETPNQSAQSRAHTLAILYSITEQVDPRPGHSWVGTKQDNRSRIGPYIELLEWGHHDGVVLGHSRFLSTERVGFGDDNQPRTVPTAELQEPLIEEWKQLRPYIRLNPKDGLGGGHGGGGLAPQGGGGFF